MGTWKKVVTESSAANISQKAATSGNADTVTNGVYTNGLSASGFAWVKNQDDMSSDSDTHLPTQQSVKAYVDAQAGTDIVTYENLSGNSDIGFGAAQVPQGSLAAPLASPTFTGAVSMAVAASSDADGGFLMQDTAGSGAVKYRTPSQVLSDIGAQASGTYYTDSANATYWTADSNRTIGISGKTLTVAGHLTVSGTTTYINSTTLEVADKLVKLANVASPDADTATGAGIQVEASGTEADFPEIKWAKAKGAGNTDGTDTKIGLTGWTVSNMHTSNHTDVPIAVMEFTAVSGGTTAPSGNAGGIGSFHFIPDNGALYLRTG